MRDRYQLHPLQTRRVSVAGHQGDARAMENEGMPVHGGARDVNATKRDWTDLWAADWFSLPVEDQLVAQPETPEIERFA